MFQVFSNKDVFLLQSANSGWLFLGTSHGGSVLRSLGSRVLNLGSEEPLFQATLLPLRSYTTHHRPPLLHYTSWLPSLVKHPLSSVTFTPFSPQTPKSPLLSSVAAAGLASCFT